MLTLMVLAMAAGALHDSSTQARSCSFILCSSF
jgi:hypothetical protein